VGGVRRGEGGGGVWRGSTEEKRGGGSGVRGRGMAGSVISGSEREIKEV